MDVATPKRQKLIDKLTKKMTVLDKSMEILNSTERVYISRWRGFWGNDCCNSETNEPLSKNIAHKKINDILLEIK